MYTFNALHELEVFTRTQINILNAKIDALDITDMTAPWETMYGELKAYNRILGAIQNARHMDEAHARRIREEIEVREEQLRAETFPEIVRYLDPN